MNKNLFCNKEIEELNLHNLSNYRHHVAESIQAVLGPSDMLWKLSVQDSHIKRYQRTLNKRRQ